MKKLSHFISSLGNSHHSTHDLENSLSSSSFSSSSSEMVNHLVNAMNETSQHSVQEISEQIGFTFPKEEFKLGPVPDDVIFHVFYFVDLTFVVSVAAKVCVQWLRVSQRMVGKRVDLTSDKNWSNSLLQECGRSVTIFLNMMSSSEAFSTITELNLSKSRIGFEGLKLFCHCSFLPKLEILNLHDNNLGNEGIELLMMKSVENLEFLDVSLNHFGKLGLQAITSSPHLKNLKTLHLNHNLLASEGISELCKNSGEWIQHLESLDLSSCGMIWENDYTTLLACEKFKNLKELSLRGNNIETVGILLMFDFLEHSPLNGSAATTISSLPLDSENANSSTTSFRPIFFIKNLTCLDLRENHIARKGEALIRDKLKNLKDFKC